MATKEDSHLMSTELGVLSPLRIVVLIPLRDDWISVAELLRRLDRALASYAYDVSVLLVDDGSLGDASVGDFSAEYATLRSVQVLYLRRNLGHQRAIAIGLVHIQKSIDCDAVLVMDGDGEDTPEGALQLLEAYTGRSAVFAKRSRRTESYAFRLFYQLYKLAHRVLTGITVEVGNFSILPRGYLDTLVVMSELWNHYAAAVIRSGLPMTKVPIPRGRRISGRSKMNFATLAAHGMSAMSVYGDIIGVRLMIAAIIGSLLALLGILGVVGIRLFTKSVIPGWATYSIGTLVIILIQCLTVAFSVTFTFLSNRINLSFVPLRDYELFVAGTESIYGSS